MDFSSIESTVHYIKSFGVYGPAAAFILFFVQAVAPIVPYIIIAGAAGMIFGKWIGFLLAWIGAIAGAWFLYWISDKIAGNLLVVKLQHRYALDLTRIDHRHIFWVLLACRIFPVVPTPIINIGSALAGVSPKIFLSSSAIGKMPWAFVYVALGNYLMQTKNISNTLTVIGLILLISFIGITYLRKLLPKYYREKQ
ncbi:MAG TPA: TVP38/TMEM64 family protein [Syntrophomonas sp.]|nr:TVP38/TMEM64 family protein [Syntrophomonas sp.]